MEPDYQTMATDLLNSGMGDSGRLRFILECIAKDKPLYNTDKRFLETLSKTLELKIQKLQTGTQKASKQKRAAKTPKKKVTAEAKKESKTTAAAADTTTRTKAKKESKTTAAAADTTTRTGPKTAKQTDVDVDVAAATNNTKDARSRTLISDEHLDKHIDQINEKRNPNRAPEEPIRKRKKSFFGRLFSK